MVPEKVIQAGDIPAPFNQEVGMGKELESSLMTDTYKEAKNNFEKAFIAKKLKEFHGNISQTSEAIGIERSNLHKKIKAYGLEKIKSQ
jgi:two-component system nitrogen regulation response regulator NtrX